MQGFQNSWSKLVFLTFVSNSIVFEKNSQNSNVLKDSTKKKNQQNSQLIFQLNEKQDFKLLETAKLFISLQTPSNQHMSLEKQIVQLMFSSLKRPILSRCQKGRKTQLDCKISCLQLLRKFQSHYSVIKNDEMFMFPITKSSYIESEHRKR